MSHLIWGITLAAILEGQALVLTILILLVFALLVASLRGVALLVSAYSWGSYWQTLRPQSTCSTAFAILCGTESSGEPGRLWLEATWLGQEAIDWRELLIQLCLDWHPHWGPWALGLLVGQTSPGQATLTELYRDLGLLHVLVISGAHFSFLAQGLSVLLVCPTRLAYITRILPFRTWLGTQLLAEVLILILVTLYAIVVAMPPPCQRAWLACTVRTVRMWTAAKHDPQRELLWVASCQAVLFPQSWVSLSNVLSWAAWAAVVRYSGKGLTGAWERECCLALLSLGFFAAFSPLGLVLNILLEPMWNILLAIVIMVLLTGQGQEAAVKGLDLFHQGLAWARDLQLVLWDAMALELTWLQSAWGRTLTVLLAMSMLMAPWWRKYSKSR